MNKTPFYPNLQGEMARRGIRPAELANCLNISSRALRNKMVGVSKFTWDEVDKIHKSYFADLGKEYLMTIGEVPVVKA